MHRGSCLCKKVTFEVSGDLQAMDACHCTFCRKSSGHISAGTDIPRENLTIHGEENLTWYTSSSWARRGFCSHCGANLFFDPLDREKIKWTGISMGAFDGPTGVKLKEHIFMGEKGDYYEVVDELPKHNTYPGDPNS